MTWLNNKTMGKHKYETGKTRVGIFLKEVAPDLLNVAGNLTGIKALNAIGGAIDGASLNPAQKANAKELLKIDILQEKERTARHQTDMTSDSWWSKNIRPLSLICLLIVVTITSVLDAAVKGFTMGEAYISLFTQLLIMVFTFYFVGREIQKGIINYKSNK